MTDPKPRSGSICTVDEMKDAIEEASHEEHLADGSKVNKKLMRVRSVSIDNTIEEKMVEVIENLKAPKEHVTVEENEETLPDGTIHITRKVTKHSFTHIERQHKQEGFVEKVFEGDVKIPGTESREILESFEKPPFPETVVEHVDEVQADGEVKQRKVIKNRMVHQVRTRHQSFDNEKGQLIEEAEIDEVIPGTESTWYADAGTDSESESETEEQQEKVDLGRVEEFADDGTVVTKEIVETRTTTTRTIHSRTGSINQETTESVLTEEFITPSPSPRSVSPADPKMGL